MRTGGYLSGGLAKDLAASISVDYATQGCGWGTNVVTGNDTFRLAHSLSARGKQDTVSPVDPYAAFQGGGISLTAEHKLDFAKLTSITAYRRGSANYLFDDVPTGRPISYVGVAPADQPNHSFSQELQLSSTTSGAFQYTAGVFYFFNRNTNSSIFRDFFPAFYGAASGPPTANQSTLTYGTERTQSVAPFGQVDIAMLPDTTLTLGGRFTYEKRDLVGNVSYNRGIKSGGFNFHLLSQSRGQHSQTDRPGHADRRGRLGQAHPAVAEVRRHAVGRLRDQGDLRHAPRQCHRQLQVRGGQIP